MATPHKDEPTPETPPAKKELPKNIPQIDVPGEAAASSARVPLEDYKGEYFRKSDGQPYALAVVPADSLGRTHKALNSQHYWEGTLAQFKAEFSDKEGTADAGEAKFKAELEARDKERKESEKVAASANKK